MITIFLPYILQKESNESRTFLKGLLLYTISGPYIK